MNLMFQPLKKYADFKGRARRSEYWLFALGIFIAAFVLGIVELLLFGHSVLGYILVLAVLVPSIAVAFRRLHDTDRSAWWLLIGLIPVAGGIVLLVFNGWPGTPGPNRFGPDPKTTETAPDPIVA